MTTVTAEKARRAEKYAGEWSLFVDWCAATGRASLPATQATVLAFLDEERPAAGTAARWLAGISAHHAASGWPSPCRGVVTAWVAASRTGTPTTGPAILESITGAVSRVPVAGWPAGQVGRRDRLAFLLHRLGEVTVEDLCALTTGDLAITEPGVVALTVRGAPVTLFQDGPAGDPGLCIACAATWWAQVLRHHAVFAHRLLADKLTGRIRDPLVVGADGHVCAAWVPGRRWPAGWPLFYGIDHRGHSTGVPVPDPITPQSLWGAFRAIQRGTWARRSAPLPPARYDNQAHGQPPAKTTPQPEPVPVALSNPGWHRDGVAARARDHDLLADADAALDALDRAAEEMQERMQQVLGSAQGG